jgi:hypothetical protein
MKYYSVTVSHNKFTKANVFCNTYFGLKSFSKGDAWYVKNSPEGGFVFYFKEQKHYTLFKLKFG